MYINNYLSEKLYGFREGLNSQYSHICLLEKWKKSLDRQETSTSLLTDLSKAFDCLNHDVLIAKLHAYGFDDSSLTFISGYLNGKVGNSYSSRAEIVSGVLSVGFILFY